MQGTPSRACGGVTVPQDHDKRNNTQRFWYSQRKKTQRCKMHFVLLNNVQVSLAPSTEVLAFMHKTSHKPWRFASAADGRATAATAEQTPPRASSWAPGPAVCRAPGRPAWPAAASAPPEGPARHLEELRSLLTQSSWEVVSPFPIMLQVRRFFLRCIVPSPSDPVSHWTRERKHFNRWSSGLRRRCSWSVPQKPSSHATAAQCSPSATRHSWCQESAPPRRGCLPPSVPRVL